MKREKRFSFAEFFKPVQWAEFFKPVQWAEFFEPVRALFESPSQFSIELQQKNLWHWFIPLGVGCAGYALFGFSAAITHASKSGFAVVGLFPLVPLLALLISLPALYIFAAFIGSSLAPRQLASTGIVALAIPGVLLAGFAPLHGFFGVAASEPQRLTQLQHMAFFFAALISYLEVHNAFLYNSWTRPQSNTHPQNTQGAVCDFGSPESSTEGVSPESSAEGASPESSAEEVSPESSTEGVSSESSTEQEDSASTKQRRGLLYLWFFLHMGIVYKLIHLLMPGTTTP